VIALPAAAAQIIARQPEGGQDDFVFAASKGKGPVSLAKPWRTIRLRRTCPRASGCTAYDHSIATLLAVGGAQARRSWCRSDIARCRRQRATAFRRRCRTALAERAAAPALAGMAAASGAPKAEVVALPGKHGRP